MSDFFQNGAITTLHKLTEQPIEELENRILSFTDRRPIALILPSLYSEIEGEALPNIIKELKKIPYLAEIVIGLDGADDKQFKLAKKFFSKLPQHHRVIWQNGPRVQNLYNLLDEKDLFRAGQGKGRNVWMCLGYLIASNKSRIFAVPIVIF